MERAELKLVRPGKEPGRRSGAAAALTLGTLLLAAALLATALGADRARRDLPSREMAQGALDLALREGNEDPQVREILLELRRALARRPLDSRTRVIYSGLLLGLCRRLEDTRAPAFHAALAARLAPVTVPVVSRAAMVLARSREPERAVDLTREMFTYDPASAADLLRRLEGSLYEEQVEAAIAATPGAWLAWARELRRAGRGAAADDRLQRAHARWPEDLPVLQALAARAVQRSDWTTLAALFPEGRTLPDERASALPLAYRARLKAERNDAAGARADVERALRLAGEGATVRLVAGDALEASGDHDGARRLWNRALFMLSRDDRTARRNVLLRLARLEDRHGRPAAALRLWRSVLELDPQHIEARRRVNELSGFNP